ncbi:MAG: sulfotransferase [Caldilineales bacterium]|nr:sulfotransferase [Caldilineales bacterium]
MNGRPVRPIVILGFGRSGTTWLSDIVSKVLGGLILFEPLHPQVCAFAADVCYATHPTADTSRQLAVYLNEVLSGIHRHRWLLRNHLFTPLEEVSQAYVDMVWNECPILGFKEIRANFLLDWLIDHFDARVVFIIRHPCAVLASLRRRPRFWEEFGRERHYRMFWERVVAGQPEARKRVRSRQGVIAAACTDLEKQAVMWALTTDLVARQLERRGLPIFRYEDFYEEPFTATRRLLAYLGEPAPRLHPAHLFVPSMTTLRTTHGLLRTENDYAVHGERLFWQDVLNEDEIATIMTIACAFDCDRFYSADVAKIYSAQKGCT